MGKFTLYIYINVYYFITNLSSFFLPFKVLSPSLFNIYIYIYSYIYISHTGTPGVYTLVVEDKSCRSPIRAGLIVRTGSGVLLKQINSSPADRLGYSPDREAHATITLNFLYAHDHNYIICSN